MKLQIIFPETCLFIITLLELHFRNENVNLINKCGKSLEFGKSTQTCFQHCANWPLLSKIIHNLTVGGLPTLQDDIVLFM
jgi:hypothetical protein